MIASSDKTASHGSRVAIIGTLGVIALVFAGCGSDASFDEPQERIADTTLTFEEWEKTVPRTEDGVYIIEGDIGITSRERLRRYFTETYVAQGALSVEQWGMAPPNPEDRVWARQRAMRLRYCVSSAFNTNRTAIVNAMNFATSQWSANAYINFQYIDHTLTPGATCDSSTASTVDFMVTPHTGPTFQAWSTIPGDPQARIEVHYGRSTSAAPYTLNGILMHELGHQLGYHHEHDRATTTSCTGSPEGPGGPSRPETPYDSLSVMHYRDCPSPPATTDYTMSNWDRYGVGVAYGPWRSTTGAPPIDAVPAGSVNGATQYVCAFSPPGTNGNDWHPGRLYFDGSSWKCSIGNGGVEQFATGSFKVLATNRRQLYSWRSMQWFETIPQEAVLGGHLPFWGALDIFVCRVTDGGSVYPGKLFSYNGRRYCTYGKNGTENSAALQFEVLLDRTRSYTHAWRNADGLVTAGRHSFPYSTFSSIQSGTVAGQTCFVCNVDLTSAETEAPAQGGGAIHTHPGRLCPVTNGYACIIENGGHQRAYQNTYRVLTGSGAFNWMSSNSTTPPPANAVWGGSVATVGTTFVCRVNQGGSNYAGKLFLYNSQWICAVGIGGAGLVFHSYEVLTH